MELKERSQKEERHWKEGAWGELSDAMQTLGGERYQMVGNLRKAITKNGEERGKSVRKSRSNVPQGLEPMAKKKTQQTCGGLGGVNKGGTDGGFRERRD